MKNSAVQCLYTAMNIFDDRAYIMMIIVTIYTVDRLYLLNKTQW